MQKKLSELNLSTPEKELKKKILNLEKKYQSLLWSIFSSNKFKEDLLKIENDIAENYNFLSTNYKIKNKIKIPAERLARFYIYNPNVNNGLDIKFIFPSPISGDLAFITDDAVINIDIKTLDINGNSGDIGNLQYLPNQSSFKHKNVGAHPTIQNSGIEVPNILPSIYKDKPVLTYFLTIIYEDNPRTNSFTISRKEEYKTIHLVNLPNGELSDLFNNELIDNFKTYKYFKSTDGFQPLLLREDSNLREANNSVITEYSGNEEYEVFEMGSKTALLDLNNFHPVYNTHITWVPVSRKNNRQYDFYLEAISSGDTNRISEEKLRIRFDSTDSQWLGVKTITY